MVGWIGAMGLWAMSTAQAGACDSYLAAAAKAKGGELVAAYKGLVKCDAVLANAEFPRFMTAGGDLETLKALAIAAIDLGAHGGVGAAMSKVPYEHRTALAQAVGDACATHPRVVEFVQASYTGLKASDFTFWQPVLATCAAPALGAWIEKTAAAPPSGNFNEKYGAVLAQLARQRGAAALAVLEAAAIKAGKEGGPLKTILETMQRAIEPQSLSASITPEDRAALEASMLRVAKSIPREQVQTVVDRLINAGSESAAATLLPIVFEDRVQAGGELLWAAAAVEACDGAAVVHWTSWTEAPTRWSVVDGATKALAGQGAKLKCDGGTWPVFASTEPLADDNAVALWLGGVVAEQEAKGLKVKPKEEKVAIP
jgi:hypothetical protein